MSNETLILVDSRDCAKFIGENLKDMLLLPEDKVKMMRRLAKEPRALSEEDELKALRKILNAIAPSAAEKGPSMPIELITIVYCLAEMISFARDDLADGALVRLRGIEENGSVGERDLGGLHDKLLAAAVREVLVVHGMLDVVMADHVGAIDLEWLREFGSRLIGGEEAFGFSAALTKVVYDDQTATLLSVEEDALDVTRYVVATYDPIPEDREWFSLIGAKISEAMQEEGTSGEEDKVADAGFSSHFFSIAGDSPEMLTELAHQLWRTPPDTVLIAVAETESDYRRLVQSITDGVLEQDLPARSLH